MGDLGREVETTDIPEPDWAEPDRDPAPAPPERETPAPERAPEREREKTPA